MLVLDQLDTHFPASVYAAFPAAEAQRLAARPEVHHTPKPGSWLNAAEIEPAVLQRPCLRRRIPDLAALAREAAAWAARRHAAGAAAAWPFTTANARTRLRGFYPRFEA